MEEFVKEVGHDIASSVQAIVAKLMHVRSGVFTGDLAKRKVQEAEDEIMSLYRVSESLGIAVDPDYNIQSGDDFNLVASIKSVCERLASEAAERHIDVRLVTPPSVDLWGDSQGMESAVTHLLLNAIKYAQGSSFITVKVVEEGSTVEVTVRDKGLPLPESEHYRIWEFGYRGDGALERHVNGSGIGLYTVRKVVAAHGGAVWVRSNEKSPVVTFGMRIPKKDILKKGGLL